MGSVHRTTVRSRLVGYIPPGETLVAGQAVEVMAGPDGASVEAVVWETGDSGEVVP